MFSKWCHAAVHGVLVGLIVLAGNAVEGAFVLTLDDLSTVGIDVIVVDDSPVGTATTKGASTDVDSNPVDGAVTYIGSVGTFTVNVSTGVSKPLLGSPNEAQIDLNSVNVSTSSGGTLVLMLTDTDFTIDTDQPLLLVNRIGGTTVGTVTAEGFFGSGNGEFEMGASTGLGAYGPGAFSDTTAGVAVGPVAGAFSLTEVVTITHSGSGASSFDKELTATVPEPTTITLLGIGLCAAGGLAARRRRRQDGARA